MPSELHILIAPSAYKGSLTASEIANAISDGITAGLSSSQISLMPLADGGDGTVEAIKASLGGVIEQAQVSGPLDNPVTASWLALPNQIVIELALCCGLTTIKEQALQPLNAHTYGLGEVLSKCLSQRTKQILIGVGGSASTDGGTGALSALGIRFLDQNKKPLPRGGGYLKQLDTIDLSQLDARIESKEIKVLTDVNSPLVGPKGAAATFGPQKGADIKQIKILEAGLNHFADIVEEITDKDLRDTAGTGAAGGTSFGLAALVKAQISPGFQTIANLIGLEAAIKSCDLVISAEGHLDLQSFVGKATGELAKLCQTFNKPLWMLPATAQENINWHNAGITAIYPTAPKREVATYDHIRNLSYQIAATLIESKN